MDESTWTRIQKLVEEAEKSYEKIIELWSEAEANMEKLIEIVYEISGKSEREIRRLMLEQSTKHIERAAEFKASLNEEFRELKELLLRVEGFSDP